MPPETVRKVKEATVYLRVGLPNGGIAQGSGFFCGRPGVVMTNAHVLGMLSADAPPPRTVDVFVHNGEPDELQRVAAVLGVDRSNDLAVLRVDGDTAPLPPPLPVDSAAGLVETQKVYVFGFPLGTQLGRNITVSESSVSSLRRDDGGRLSQVQVNGGMHPGNSGGPVADTRGVVVGVSVAVIRGTQINFAIPGDLVKQVLAGRVLSTELGTAYLSGGRPTVPVQLTCLDPLNRVRQVQVEVWTGSPGKTRPPAAGQPPAPQPGDGSRRTVTATARDGGGYGADVPLPAAEPGKVYWLQPVCAGPGGRRWDSAVAVAPDDLVPVERKPAAVRFQPPAAAVERTLQMKTTTTVTVYQGNEGLVFREKMEGNILESLWPDQRGTGTAVRLTLADCPFTREAPGKTLVPPPQAKALLAQFAPTFLVDGGHACKERGRRNFAVLPPAYRDMVEGMYETVCNTYEATTVPLPNRTLQPGESWDARMPMFVLVKDKRQIQDLFVICTYEGTRSAAGRTEAHVRLAGEVKGRGPNAARVLGKAKGHALVDLDGGFLSLAKLTVLSEAEAEDAGLRVLVSEESSLSRTPGNTQGIRAATANQPGPGVGLPR
jgi:hypothetical protein